MGSNNPTVGSSNISFSSLKSAYYDASITNASGNSNLTDGMTTTPISLSFFRGATFTDSTSVPSSGEISINDDFKSKTFGSSSSSSPEFEWYYYAYGSNIGVIYIYWLNSSNNSLNLLRSISGQQHTGTTQSWDQYTEDLSSYAGQTGRIVIAYKTGSSFRQDIQLDDMELKETTSGTIDLDPGTSTGRSNWQKRTSYTTSLSYPTSSWSSISISISASNVWNYDSGGTGSGSTGGTRDVSGSTSGYYLYFEGSSPNFSSSTRYYWLRTTNSYTLSGGSGGGDGGGDDGGGGGMPPP